MFRRSRSMLGRQGSGKDLYSTSPTLPSLINGKPSPPTSPDEGSVLDQMIVTLLKLEKRSSELCTTHTDLYKKSDSICKTVLTSDKTKFHKFFEKKESPRQSMEFLSIVDFLTIFLEKFLYEKYFGFKTDPIWQEVQKKREKVSEKRELKILGTVIPPEVHQNFKKYADKNKFIWEYDLLHELTTYRALYHSVMLNDKISVQYAFIIAEAYKELKFSRLTKLEENPNHLITDSDLLFQLIDEILTRNPEKKEIISLLITNKKQLQVLEHKSSFENKVINKEREALIIEQKDYKFEIPLQNLRNPDIMTKEELLLYYCQEDMYDEFVSLLKEVPAWKPIKNTRGCTLLHLSVVKGCKITEFLIENGLPIDVEEEHGRTPLFYSCSVGNKEGTLHLLGNKAQVNWKDLAGASPLSICLRRHYFDLANHLVLFGADVNYKKPNGSTYLHEAIILQDKEMFDWLLNQFVKLNIKDYMSDTPLLKSTSLSDTYFFSKLFEIGTVDVGCLTNIHKNLVQHLVINQKIDFLKLFLKTPSSNLKRYENLFKAVDSDGNSILHLAIQMKKFALVKVLVIVLKHLELPFDQFTNAKGETAIEFASSHSKYSLDQFLDLETNSPEIGKIGEIVKIAKFLEDYYGRKDNLVAPEQDTVQYTKLFESIRVNTGETLAGLSKHHRLVIFTIKAFHNGTDQEIMDQIGNMMSYFIQWNTIPLIGHQEKDYAAREYFEHARGVTKHLRYCRIATEERKMFGLTIAPLSEQLRALGGNLSAMFNEKRRSLSILSSSPRFGVFTVEDGFLVKKLIYKDASKRLNFGILLQDMSEFVPKNQNDKKDIKQYFKDIKEVKVESGKSLRVLNAKSMRKSRSKVSSGKLRRLDGELDNKDQQIVKEMNDIMDDETKRYFFKVYATNEFELESLQFCEDVKIFKNQYKEPKVRERMFERIYLNYLADGGISQIIVSSLMVEPIKKLFLDGSKNIKMEIFDDIYKDVRQNVLLDLFADFKLNPLYQEMLNKKTTVTYLI